MIKFIVEVIVLNKWLKYLLVGIGIIVVIVIGLFIYFKVTYLSKNEIKEIVIKDIGTDLENVHFDSIDFEINKRYYDVELYYDNVEYEYKINALTGKIIYTNFYNIVNNNDTSNDIDNSNTSEKTIDDAKQIALEHEKLDEKDVVFIKTQTDLENGMRVYDIEFIYNNYEYDYEISALTGKIISYDKEPVR